MERRWKRGGKNVETVRKGGNKVKTHDVEWKRSGKKVEIRWKEGGKQVESCAKLIVSHIQGCPGSEVERRCKQSGKKMENRWYHVPN